MSVFAVPAMPIDPSVVFPEETQGCHRLRNPSIILAVLVLGGCLAIRPPATLLEVPFIPQTDPNHCGVTCLAMAFAHFRVPYHMELLKRDAYIPVLSGSTPELLADIAEAHGLRSDIRTLSAAQLRDTLLENRIPIVFFPPAPPENVGHFVLVTAVTHDLRRLRAHDGGKRNRWLPAPGRALAILISP